VNINLGTPMPLPRALDSQGTARRAHFHGRSFDQFDGDHHQTP
jgi:ribosomal protein S10